MLQFAHEGQEAFAMLADAAGGHVGLAGDQLVRSDCAVGAGGLRVLMPDLRSVRATTLASAALGTC